MQKINWEDKLLFTKIIRNEELGNIYVLKAQQYPIISNSQLLIFHSINNNFLSEKYTCLNACPMLEYTK